MSDVTHLFGLTSRAVRYYDQCGLVTVYRDHLNRRVFDWRARVRLQVIVTLRRCGLSLRQVKQVLAKEAAGPEAQLELSRELVDARRLELERQGARLNDALVQLERALRPSAVGAHLRPVVRARLVGRPRRITA